MNCLQAVRLSEGTFSHLMRWHSLGSRESYTNPNPLVQGSSPSGPTKWKTLNLAVEVFSFQHVQWVRFPSPLQPDSEKPTEFRWAFSLTGCFPALVAPKGTAGIKQPCTGLAARFPAVLGLAASREANRPLGHGGALSYLPARRNEQAFHSEPFRMAPLPVRGGPLQDLPKALKPLLDKTSCMSVNLM